MKDRCIGAHFKSLGNSPCPTASTGCSHLESAANLYSDALQTLRNPLPAGEATLRHSAPEHRSNHCHTPRILIAIICGKTSTVGQIHLRTSSLH